MQSQRSLRGRIAAEQVRNVDGPVLVGGANADMHRPTVELEPLGPGLTEVRVRCQCGEEIVLHCRSQHEGGE
ncbi:MAG: hypothetical protein KDA75_06995 [Planctomycetaceae bacterium]|nr:hypothetical protein [Planctomycetaceae bacterium]